MEFFDTFSKLCEQKGVSRYRACTDIGLNRAAVAKWKGGSLPTGATLAKLGDYFGVTADYLLTGEEPAGDTAIDVVDEELREYLEELRSRPEKKMLFSVTKNATKEQIEAIVRMIEAMQGGGDKRT